jgi:RNA polymerase sigma factor (TIGR02999 family)
MPFSRWSIPSYGASPAAGERTWRPGRVPAPPAWSRKLAPTCWAPTARWSSRSHFFYLASVAIRNLLVDHAKYASRQKRAGIHEELNDALALDAGPPPEEILAIDEALHRLAAEDERLAKIVECRFFGGYTVEETAESLGLSPSTVKRGWDTARAWLYGQLKAG